MFYNKISYFSAASSVMTVRERLVIDIYLFVLIFHVIKRVTLLIVIFLSFCLFLEPTDPALFEAPPPPSTVLEALEQRLQKYSATKAAAEAEGNTSKVRRLQRIIKVSFI